MEAIERMPLREGALARQCRNNRCSPALSQCSQFFRRTCFERAAARQYHRPLCATHDCNRLGNGLLIVGCCLLLTAALLTFSYYARPRQKETISLRDAFIIGISQAFAVLPGLSRSGSTIATGLILGNKKSSMAQFSFLMVIPPILGEALLDLKEALEKGVSEAFNGLSVSAMIVGFLAAFISGMAACKWMINIVSKGKLIYFAYYCVVAGVLTIVLPLILGK